MPLTNIALVEQHALHPDPVALTNGERMAEKAAARRAAWALKRPEQAERNRLSIEEHSANRSAAFADGNGELFDLMTYPALSDFETARRDQLYWEKYGLQPAPVNNSLNKEAA